MKSFLGAVILVLCLCGGAVEAQEIYDMRTAEYGDTQEVTLEKFWLAYGVAVAAYGYALPPERVIISTDFLIQNHIAGFYDVPTRTVWLNISVLKEEEYLIYTLIHEIGHHLLTLQKVPIEQQHCEMYSMLDAKALKLLGLDPNKMIDPFTAMFACQ